MSSYRTKSSSGWSKWTWTPEHSCETRFRTKGSDQEWQFKNEKGEIKSTSVNGTGPVDSNWEDESTGRHQSKSAVIGEDDTVVDSATQMVSNMALQDPPPQGWGDPGSDQRQDTMKTVSYSNRVYAENYAALSSGTGSKPPPGQQQHYPKPRWVNTRSGTISPDQPGTLFDNDKRMLRRHQPLLVVCTKST
ncbi:hypothetical protein DL98DRAFT_232205 [Cadophora sp. DSE1049]|nr:hypothetical protein DL98DRAFT_232205 [Cadophora sp. DSE1049]